ncbi:MAG: glycosyltransferase, partial [Enterobacterales bacterium]|nr:glycosyltransferase [Enterobacterales bacterium]
MRWILDLFLMTPARQALADRYRQYRQYNEASPLGAALGCFWLSMAWLFLKLESPRWQQIRSQQTTLFPHIDAQRPRPLDIVRYAIQSLWLIVFSAHRSVKSYGLGERFKGLHNRYHDWLKSLPDKVQEHGAEESEEAFNRLGQGVRRIILGVMCVFSTILALLCISQPFDLSSQFVFVLLLWGIAMVVRRIPGRFSSLMMIVLSLTVSCRYIWWRYTSTLNWDDPVSLICGLLLLAAETYAWVVLVLGYFQTIWPLNRQPAPMPEDVKSWPTIDIMVPTYNEDMSVVKPTIYAALGIDWPKEKLNIWLLDDGGREEFREFAETVGVKYIARTTHEHAKAGNINNALKQATGEFVAIFDCDHVPTRSFLQLTLGWFFKDKKLGMMQTPHHFFSPDPFERNLGRFRRTPNEGTLFYGLLQDGNDMWDATFFCGSCAVLRRTALDEVGGIAVETVTEDAHTSLRLHRRGWTSAYIRIPQAAGLATESLSAHIGQRIRWARGMVQIFRLDNPLFGKGLKLAQRICYANAML